MTRRVPVRAAALVAAALTVLGAAAVGLGALGRHGALLVHQCVADGTAGAIGLRLALLRQDAACPSGLAVGPDGRQAIGVVVLVAVPVLVAHVVGLLAGAGLLARARAGVLRALAVLAGRRPLPGPVTDLHLPGRPVVEAPAPAPWRDLVRGGAVLRRGPPVAAVA